MPIYTREIKNSPKTGAVTLRKARLAAKAAKAKTASSKVIKASAKNGREPSGVVEHHQNAVVDKAQKTTISSHAKAKS